MFQDIIVNRIGKSANSYMKTKRIIREITPQMNHRIMFGDIIPLPESTIIPRYNYEETIPKYIDVPCKWLDDKTKRIKNNNNNILGDLGVLFTNSKIDVPINVANHNNVKYYSAELYNMFDIINFRCVEPLPLTYMSIGVDYVKDYIEQYSYGGGQYLEFHNNPHFHTPLNSECEGYYILGKTFHNTLRLSAFEIPLYKALYTPGYMVHSDANLVGNWLVIYSKTDTYSTVLLRDADDKMTKIEFV